LPDTELSGQTSFPEEIASSKNRDDGFLALLRDDGGLGFSHLYAENRIGGIAVLPTVLRGYRAPS